MKTRGKSVAGKTKAARAPVRRAAAAILLAEECTLAQARALHSQLTAIFTKPIATIDVSAVKRIDAANLQVLAAFARDRHAGGRTVQWLGTSQALTQASHRLGLQALFA
jgi:anti-anti-sigma regulatory factor